jgi:hypothetical protein
MVWGPPRGSITDIKKPSVGVAWLLEEGFLIPFNQQTVVLPREVAIYLRGNTVHRELETSQPSVTGSKRDMRNVQLAAIANITHSYAGPKKYSISGRKSQQLRFVQVGSVFVI